MSEANVEIVRRVVEAFNRRDLDALVERFDPEAVVDWSRSPGVEAGVYRGHPGVRRLIGGFYDAWDRVTVSPDELIDRGEHVVVPNRALFRGRDGIEVAARGVFVNTLRDGRVVELRLYRERAEALESLGPEE